MKNSVNPQGEVESSTTPARLEQQMRDLVDCNLDGMLVIGLDGIALFANPAASDLLNRPRETILGKEIGLPLSGGGHTEIEILQPGGSTCTVEMRVHRIEWAGQPAWLASLRDITWRKQAEKKLEAERSFSQAVIDALSSNLCVLNEDGRIVSVNRAWMEFAESNPPVPANYALGENYLAICDQSTGEYSEEAQPFAEGLRAVLHGKQANFHLEYPCHEPGGEERWFNAHVTRFQTGDALRVVVSHENITTRIMAEKSLRQSEERHRQISALMSDYVYSGRVFPDGSTKTDWISGAFERLTGYSVEEINRLPGGFSALVFPQDLEAILRQQSANFALGAFSLEYRIARKDGEIRWLMDHIQYLKGNDNENHAIMLGAVQDITERKQAELALVENEEKMRSIFRVAPTGIGVVKDRVLLEVNPRICEMSGYTRDELIGQGAQMLYPSQEEFDFVGREKYRQIAEKGTGQVESRWLKKNGETIDLLLASTPIDLSDLSKGMTFTALDITDRKQAEKALRESEDKFKYIFDNSTVAKSVTSVDSRLHANRAFCEMLGYSREELESISWREITHPDDVNLNLREVNEILAGKKETARFIKRYIHRNGSVVWVDLNTSLRRDINGKPLYFMTTALDITERVKAGEALRKSEERFELAMLAVNDGIWDWDIPNDKVYFDQRYYTMAGYEPDEFPQAFDEWTRRVHPDDIERCMEIINAHLAGKTNVFDIEFRFRRKDGTWMWLRGRGKAVKHDENGKVSRMIGTHTDITDRKRAEEELHQRENLLNKIFDVLPVGLWLADKNGNLVRSNQAGREIWGAEPLVGQEGYGVFKARRLSTGEDIAPDDWALTHTIHEGVTTLDEMLEIDCFDGRRKIILNYTTPVLDEGNKVDGAVIVNLDVTDRMKAEEAIRQSERQMQALLTSLDDIVFEFDADGTYLNIWATDESLLIKPKKQMLGMGVMEIMGEQGSKFAGAIKRVTLGGSPESIEYPLEVMGGRRWFTARVNPIFSATGNTVSVLVRDITERKRVEEQVQVQLQRVRALNEIDRAISSSLDMRLSLDILLTQTLAQLKVDAGCVLLLDPSSQTLEYAAGKGFRSNAIRQSRVLLGQGLAGKAGLERKTVHVEDLSAIGDEFLRRKALQGENFIEYFAVPLIAKGLLKGALEIFHRSRINLDLEWLNYLETLGGQAAIAIDNAQLFEGMQMSNLELVAAYDATIEGWSRAMDLRDKETEGHTLRVTELTVKLAKRMGISQQEITHMRRGALLHDIGKLGVPDHILNKTGELDRVEWAIMRQHPSYAFNMLLPINYLRPALDIPYCHHEKWDGSGYPRGLKGEQIPLAARIFAIVDVWDALRSDRPYRKGWAIEKIREYFVEESGKHFDPQVVTAFLPLLEDEKI